jgi:hypothetical protein
MELQHNMFWFSKAKTLYVFKFSQLPDVLTYSIPADCISNQIRSWDFPFRAFFLNMQLYIVSNAYTLLPLDNLPVITSPLQ